MLGQVEEDSSDDKESKCFGTLMNMDLDEDLFLVGDLFMRKYYSIFDRENDRIGLAKAVHVS